MILCINPNCTLQDQPQNDNNRFCQSCGSELLLQGKYQITQLLSDKSGFGKIYIANSAGTPKIIKMLKAELNNNAKAVELFEQEANILGELNSPGIPKVDGYFQVISRNGFTWHCIAMEKIEGLNLEQVLQQQGNSPINQEQAIGWLRQLIEILHLIHSKNYLHRDIKPSNIMLKNDGHLVLIDFGTAREMTATYLVAIGAGNPITSIESRGYTAPEQINGQAVPQSDFFALGRTFVHLLTGRYPLTMYDAQNDILNWRSYASHIDPLLLDFIDYLMIREVNKRPGNTQILLQRIGEIESELSDTVNVVGRRAKATTITQPVNTQKRHNFSPIVIGGLLLALIAFLGGNSNKQNTQTNTNTQSDKFPIGVLIGVPLLLVLIILLLSLFNPKLRCYLGLPSSACATASNPKITPKRLPGQPPKRQGKIDFFPYEKGADKQGRTAEFNIAVLSIEYKWKLGSSYQIQYNDRVINVDTLKSNLEEQGIQKIMENPSEIISIGTASCEGEATTEERRALDRAMQIQLLGKRLFGKIASVKNYRLLNLGQFRQGECNTSQESTSYQRSLIIMGVKNQTPGVIIDEALRSRLINKPFADFSLEDYTLGTPEKFKTIPSKLQ